MADRKTRTTTPSVLTALNAALRVSKPEGQDAATVALAKRYALELDEAVVISVKMTKALRRLADCDGVDAELFEQFEALAARIEATHVSATIGPKLLAALEQLHLTPKARIVVKGGGVPSAGPSELDKLRARRQGRAAAVD